MDERLAPMRGAVVALGLGDIGKQRVAHVIGDRGARHAPAVVRGGSVGGVGGFAPDEVGGFDGHNGLLEGHELELDAEEIARIVVGARHERLGAERGWLVVAKENGE